MRKIMIFMALVVMAGLISCNNGDTYADQLDREKAAIAAYINNHHIKVISEEQFFAQDSMTNVADSEYVLMNSTGVYMQIIHKGCGEKIKSGETATVLCRFSEYSVSGDSLSLSNNNLYYSAVVDKMSLTNTLGTYTAAFDSRSSVMYSVYGSSSGSTSVPGGWLVPLPYIKIGREEADTDTIAEVKLIVPSAQGHSYSSSNVTPYAYHISYQRGR